jgi:hypothetical protein
MSMSDPRASFDTVFGRDPGDAMMNLIAAARDAWTLGLSALRAISEQTGAAGPRPSQEAVPDPITTLVDASAGFATLLSELVARRAQFGAATAAGRALGSGDLPQGGELYTLLTQTWVVCATSALLYWRDLAEVYVSHQPALIQSVARGAMPAQLSTPEEGDRLLADELRACLREIGEVAGQQARRLQSELERISEAVAHGFDQPDAPESYQRRWKAKD